MDHHLLYIQINIYFMVILEIIIHKVYVVIKLVINVKYIVNLNNNKCKDILLLYFL